ncbi:hypothetical protein IKE72_00775 [Candidatus Saccharibacteria bacterium]|nr:hypothetical protein [Candidatus Saccharibacteria bacterium]
MSKSTHRRMQASTTLSRRYTKRPTMRPEIRIPKSLKINKYADRNMSDNSMMSASKPMSSSQSNSSVYMSRMQPSIYNIDSVSSMNMMDSSMPAKEMMQPASPRPVYAPEVAPVYPDTPIYPDEPVNLHPMQKSANEKMRARANMQSTASTQSASSMSAQELKEQAIKKALMNASQMEDSTTKKEKKVKESKKVKKVTGMHFGFGRVLIALACAATAVMAIVYFVNLNMPDISLSVAAMQNGVNAAYPSYIPRDYNVSSVTSENGKVTMVFNNSTENKSFTLVEENSSWDSNALMNNFVKSEYGENYSVVKEQGLTLYISGSNAAWVNGGNLYKIIAQNGTLTNKQIKSIAVSL